MNYTREHLITALKAARMEKGLSQRDLSDKSGVPQSHISKIEKGMVDLQLSSLIELARALGLEVMPVPRKLVPTVQAIVRRSEPPSLRLAKNTRRAANELKRIQETAKRLKPLFRGSKELGRIQITAAELANFPVGVKEFETILSISARISEIEEGPRALQDIKRAADALQRLRNFIVHHHTAPAPVAGPAYTLGEDDDA